MTVSSRKRLIEMKVVKCDVCLREFEDVSEGRAINRMRQHKLARHEVKQNGNPEGGSPPSASEFVRTACLEKLTREAKNDGSANQHSPHEEAPSSLSKTSSASSSQSESDPLLNRKDSV